ncbi:MAG: hypothetical protein MJ165_03265 [Alphaproteobacteria bacterium]|nr:hypothetical protein [Alphaproteobacteria bacterium]
MFLITEKPLATKARQSFMDQMQAKVKAEEATNKMCDGLLLVITIQI